MMLELSAFFQKNLIIIFFVYGLSFFAIASAVILSLKSLSKIDLAAASLYLILFSVIHGAVEWIDMYAQYKRILYGLSLDQATNLIRFFMLFASLYILLLFGLELLLQKRARLKIYIIAGSIAVFLFISISLVLSDLLRTRATDVENISRCLLGFPAALIAGIGLYRLSRNNYAGILTEDYRWYLKAIAYVFVLYGIFAGIIGPKSNILPGSLVNQNLFSEYAGLPVQLLRASTVFFMAYCIVRAMPLSITIRILGSLSAVSTIIFILWVASYINFTNIRTAYDQIVKLEGEGKDFSYLSTSFNRLYNFIGNPDIARSGQMYAPLLKEYIQDFESAINRVKTMEHTEEEEIDMIHQISSLSEPIIRGGSTHVDTAALKKMGSLIYKIDAMHKKEMKETQEEIQQTFTNVNIVTVSAFLLSVLGVILIGRAVSQLIINPIHRLRFGTKQIAAGDLAHRIVIRTADELEHCAKDFNVMAEKLQERTVKLENLTEEFKQLAITDGLTGLFNHRHFYNMVKIEFEKAKRYNKTFSLLVFDIDHFKHYNDKHGHLNGDTVLKTIGELIRKNTRISDMAYRYGGEEFAILLPETDKQHATMAAEKIRRIIQSHPFLYEQTQPLGDITVSIGVASYPADTKEIKEARELIEKADSALYEAKNGGRNRVCVYQAQC